MKNNSEVQLKPNISQLKKKNLLFFNIYTNYAAYFFISKSFIGFHLPGQLFLIFFGNCIVKHGSSFKIHRIVLFEYYYFPIISFASLNCKSSYIYRTKNYFSKKWQSYVSTSVHTYFMFTVNKNNIYDEYIYQPSFHISLKTENLE